LAFVHGLLLGVELRLVERDRIEEPASADRLRIGNGGGVAPKLEEDRFQCREMGATESVEAPDNVGVGAGEGEGRA
jgi:hypothetical protein